MPMGNKYGTHRVLEPAGALPQAAQRLDNDMSVVYDNEILVDVSALNIDSASFTQIEAEAGGDVELVTMRCFAALAATWPDRFSEGPLEDGRMSAIQVTHG